MHFIVLLGTSIDTVTVDMEVVLLFIHFVDTVFGNGKTPDYLLLGNMVYTVSVLWK